MNETLKAIVRVLEEGTPELKVAASQVLGELSPKDQGVVQALSSNLTVGDNTLNRYILQALASIGSAEAIKILVGRVGAVRATWAAALTIPGSGPGVNTCLATRG